jgi:hypothetical protein
MNININTNTNKKMVLLNKSSIRRTLSMVPGLTEDVQAWVGQVFVPYVIRNYATLCYKVIVDSVAPISDGTIGCVMKLVTAPEETHKESFEHNAWTTDSEFQFWNQHKDQCDVYYFSLHHPTLRELFDVFDFLEIETRGGHQPVPRDPTRLSVPQAINASIEFHNSLARREVLSVDAGTRLAVTHKAFSCWRVEFLLDKQAFEHESCIQRNCVRDYWPRYQRGHCRIFSVVHENGQRYTVETMGSVDYTDMHLTVLQVRAKCNVRPDHDTQHVVGQVVAQVVYNHDRKLAIAKASVWRILAHPIRKYLGLRTYW